MASQVLSGSSNPTYTNNTGQNVRIIINFMAGPSSVSWAGISYSSSLPAIGRNLAFYGGGFLTGSGVGLGVAGNNALGTVNTGSGTVTNGALPTELMLAPGQSFSATCSQYNIVVIPEAG